MFTSCQLKQTISDPIAEFAPLVRDDTRAKAMSHEQCVQKLRYLVCFLCGNCLCLCHLEKYSQLLSLCICFLRVFQGAVPLGQCLFVAMSPSLLEQGEEREKVCQIYVSPVGRHHKIESTVKMQQCLYQTIHTHCIFLGYYNYITIIL